MKKKALCFLLLGALLGALCGCTIKSPEQLYALPKLPEEFNDLQEKINEVTVPGGTYPAGADLINPVSGTNTQTVQQRDLNGDGVPEAIAFFRATGEERPLKIYIFSQESDGYVVKAVIEGDGTAIDSVTYENLNESASQEILVSWQLSANVRNLTAYAIRGGQAEKLMEATGYSSYRLLDVDRNNLREILVVQLNTVDGTNRVDCWQAAGEGLERVSSAPMSLGITSVVAASPQQGFLRAELPVPALFVTSYVGDGCITDVFAWRDGGLVNVTLDEELQYSSSTVRQDSEMLPRDIDEDGCTEVPISVDFTAPFSASSSDCFYSWRQFDLEGNAWPVYTTYHSERDKNQWYFILPNEWEGKLAVSSREVISSGERQVTFSYQSGKTDEEGYYQEAVPFLTLYKLTGSGRMTRARLGNRFVLTSDGSTVYAAEFLECDWECGLNEESILEHFKLVTASYSGES